MEQLNEYIKSRLSERSTKAGAVLLASIAAWYGDIASEQVIVAINGIVAVVMTVTADKAPA